MITKPIFRDGVLIGYRLYSTGGIFGTLTFRGYKWII